MNKNQFLSLLIMISISASNDVTTPTCETTLFNEPSFYATQQLLCAANNDDRFEMLQCLEDGAVIDMRELKKRLPKRHSGLWGIAEYFWRGPNNLGMLREIAQYQRANSSKNPFKRHAKHNKFLSEKWKRVLRQEMLAQDLCDKQIGC